jgi:ABC-type Mn2+/Zn2+ transport system permease subunit
MVVFRFLAAVFLLAATIALVIDATPPIYGAGPFVATSLAAHWQELAPSAFDATRQAVTGLSPWIWESILTPLLALPTFIIFGALALMSGYAGRRRKTVRVFVN